jgi:hypothetical protein
LLSYLRAHPALTAVVYSPLLGGAYVRDDKPLGVEYEHPGTWAQRGSNLRPRACEACGRDA